LRKSFKPPKLIGPRPIIEKVLAGESGDAITDSLKRRLSFSLISSHFLVFYVLIFVDFVMTSGGNSIEPSVVAEAEKMLFCYQYDQTITISITSSADPCPLCNGGFLDEYVDPNPNPIPNLILPMSDPISSRFSFIPVMDFTNPSFLGESMEPQSTQQQLNAFDPVRLIHNHLLQLQSRRYQCSVFVRESTLGSS